MAVEKRSDHRLDEQRRGRGHRGNHDHGNFFGMDVESMSPKSQAVTGVVTGGVILLAAALLILFTDLWWMIFIFGWWLIPAWGMFARGVAGLIDSPRPERLPENYKERELLGALQDRGELTPAQAAMETSLTVAEADKMLKELAEGGHLDVRVRGGGLFYALWDHEDREELEGRQ